MNTLAALKKIDLEDSDTRDKATWTLIVIAVILMIIALILVLR